MATGWPHGGHGVATGRRGGGHGVATGWPRGNWSRLDGWAGSVCLPTKRVAQQVEHGYGSALAGGSGILPATWVTLSGAVRYSRKPCAARIMGLMTCMTLFFDLDLVDKTRR